VLQIIPLTDEKQQQSFLEMNQAINFGGCQMVCKKESGMEKA